MIFGRLDKIVHIAGPWFSIDPWVPLTPRDTHCDGGFETFGSPMYMQIR